MNGEKFGVWFVVFKRFFLYNNSNVSGDEKMFLTQLVAQYKDVIEYKKTDCISVARKKKTWESIHNEFNSMAQHTSVSIIND